MNRRRFLSMLGAIPAALALPSLPALTKPSGMKIVVQSPMNGFRSDLQYATVLSNVCNTIDAARPLVNVLVCPVHGGDTILPTRRAS